MVFSATGAVRKTWPAAENSSVFRLLWHRRHKTIASATGNSLDRICCNARGARTVRCGGSLFSRRAPQPPDGTAHERRYQSCPRWPKFSCRSGLYGSLSRPGCRHRKRRLHRSGDAVFLGFTHCQTPPARFSPLHSFQSPILSRLALQYSELPKHIAGGFVPRLSTTEF
jgi:hypothetical protein